MNTIQSSPPLSLHSTFPGALRGIWLFTWKTHFAWRRLPIGALLLAALPLLVYLTTSAPKAWARRIPWAPPASAQLDRFSRRLNRSQTKLQPEQRTALLRIFQEEYEKANAAMGENSPGGSDLEVQRAEIKGCYDRITARAKTVLEERQFADFQVFQKRKEDESLAAMGEPMWGRTTPFYHWLIDFYFFIVLPLNCVRLCGGLIRDELQADTLCFLTTRPISRGKLLVAKYLSQTGYLQIVAVIQALLLFGVAYLREVPSLGKLLPLFLAAQFLAVIAWSGLGAFLGQVTNRYVALALVYGFVVELGIGRIPTNINTLSIMRHLKTLLARDGALEGIYGWSSQGALLSVLALLMAGSIFLALSAFLFTVREYHHTAEMQK